MPCESNAGPQSLTLSFPGFRPGGPAHTAARPKIDVCGSWYDMRTAVSHTGRYEWGFFQVEVTPSLQYGRPVRS